MEKCYLLFGSNMGDKTGLFDQAYLLINKRCGKIVATSSFYESEPGGFETEEWFINRVIVVETELKPEELLRRLLNAGKFGKFAYYMWGVGIFTLIASLF